MSTEVRVPALGESVTEATIATWFKKAGDTVAVDEMLCELETDKVTVEVPSPTAGVLAEIVAEEGATVEPNALLAQIDESAKGADSARPSAQEGSGQDGGKGAKQDAGEDAKQDAGQDAKQDKAAVRASAESPEE
ncbi:dihydrolipoamide succinyltransferase, partial [Paracoccus sp. (in: a-proteobacteria)]|nr:dihydrolipoamide succinyltransferase [Paracoccus sp. (in: a-proteobacteria)]